MVILVMVKLGHVVSEQMSKEWKFTKIRISIRSVMTCFARFECSRSLACVVWSNQRPQKWYMLLLYSAHSIKLSEATCRLPTDCCASVSYNYKYPTKKACWSSTHVILTISWNVACSRHDKAEKWLIWR